MLMLQDRIIETYLLWCNARLLKQTQKQRIARSKEKPIEICRILSLTNVSRIVILVTRLSKKKTVRDPQNSTDICRRLTSPEPESRIEALRDCEL